MAQLWGGRFTKETDKLVYNFNASISFDQRFYEQDIKGSMAHVMMLCKQGILTEEEKKAILDGLTGILEDVQSGKLEITEEYEALKVKEAQSKEFLASLNENPDSIRPKYDFNKTQSEIYAYEEKIRKIKHALNKFNVNTLIPGFGITIDEMLVLIPQLTKQKAKLGAMKDRLPKMREKVVGYGANGVIDYRYINYDIDEVYEEYQLVSEKLTKAQLALDNVNTTFTFEIDI